MKTRRRSTLACLALATACALSAPRMAYADVADAATRDAKVRFEEGLKRYEAQDYDGARLAFLQAFAVLHAVDILFNLSLSELRSEHPVEALQHLKQYLRDERLTPQERERATKYLSEAHGKTGHVWIEAAAGSKLSVDAKLIEVVAPLREAVDVVAGRRVVEVQTGALKRILEVNAVAGETVTARFMGDGPPVVVAGAPANPSPVVPPKDRAEPAHGFWTARTVTSIALAGGALAAVGVGVGFTLAARGQRDDASSAAAKVPAGSSSCAGVASADCGTLRDANHAKQNDQNIAMGAFITGGALAVGAIAAWILWPSASSESKQARTFLVPIAGPGGAGAQLVGRF